jgi:hypothetical protein
MRLESIAYPYVKISRFLLAILDPNSKSSLEG